MSLWALFNLGDRGAAAHPALPFFNHVGRHLKVAGLLLLCEATTTCAWLLLVAVDGVVGFPPLTTGPNLHRTEKDETLYIHTPSTRLSPSRPFPSVSRFLPPQPKLSHVVLSMRGSGHKPRSRGAALTSTTRTPISWEDHVPGTKHNTRIPPGWWPGTGSNL
eukprot:1220541-Rhodomonas_salina.3